MNLQVGVKVLLVNQEGKVLVLCRKEQYGNVADTDRWDIPGGRIEVGATLMDNLVREVKEETRLDLITAPVLLAAQDILKDDRHVVRLTYLAGTAGEPVLNPEEHTEYRWVPKEEVAELPNLDRYIRELLQHLEK